MVAMKNRNCRGTSSASVEILRRFRKLHRLIVCVIAGLFLFWIWMVLKLSHQAEDVTATRPSSPSLSVTKTTDLSKVSIAIKKNTTIATTTSTRDHRPTCPSSTISILNDLTDEQRNPTIGKRWMVRPPTGGNLHLMCCDTTVGSFHVLLHERWAPIGVPHLLAMLKGGYFDADMPLFRCTDACQFGLSSNATLTKAFQYSISDDPLWLPTGPEHRFSSGSEQTKTNIKRYPKGVWTHAGSGKNSRSTQFVLTLKPNKFMGGGSPWEVPLGEVVDVGEMQVQTEGENDHEFVDVWLPPIYTGYREKGPGQGVLRREGASESVREKWPLLDYVLSCSIVDRFLEDGDHHVGD